MNNMKKLLASLTLGLSLLIGAGAVMAQTPATPAASDAAPAATAAAAPASEAPAAAAPATEAAAAPATAAASAPAAAAAAAPVPNKGDTSWMLVSTLLVILMVVPGLALF
jgi:Amt family ammonium transporter